MQRALVEGARGGGEAQFDEGGHNEHKSSREHYHRTTEGRLFAEDVHRALRETRTDDTRGSGTTHSAHHNLPSTVLCPLIILAGWWHSTKAE